MSKCKAVIYSSPTLGNRGLEIDYLHENICETAHIYYYGYIFRCTWKGKTCDPNAITLIDTDMGRCFHFKPPDMVEQTGNTYEKS